MKMSTNALWCAALLCHQVAQLHAMLRPYLLRRVKEDVEKSLPPKVRRVLHVIGFFVPRTARCDRNRQQASFEIQYFFITNHTL